MEEQPKVICPECKHCGTYIDPETPPVINVKYTTGGSTYPFAGCVGADCKKVNMILMNVAECDAFEPKDPETKSES